MTTSPTINPSADLHQPSTLQNCFHKFATCTTYEPPDRPLFAGECVLDGLRLLQYGNEEQVVAFVAHATRKPFLDIRRTQLGGTDAAQRRLQNHFIQFSVTHANTHG